MNLLLLSLWVQIASAVIVLLRNRNPFSPFLILHAGFVFTTFSVLTNQLLPDPLGVKRSLQFTLSAEVSTYLLLASVIMFIITLFLPKGPIGKIPGRIELRFEKLVLLGISALCLGELAVGVVLGGGVPLLVMGRGGASGYGDFRIGFLSVVAHGSAKFLFLYLMLRLLNFKGYSFEFLRDNFLLIFVTIGCLGMNFLGGLRNLLLLPLIFAAYVLLDSIILTKRLKFMIFISAVLFVPIFFVVIGSFRTSSLKFTGLLLANPTDIAWLDSALSWFYLYLFPSYLNLDGLLVSFSEFQHGRILLSLIIPDRILWEFGLLPQVTAIEYLSSNLLLPYSGLTFRTLFADLYADFGYAGSLLTGAFFLGASVWLYRKRGQSLLCMFLFMNCFKGLYMFPLKFSFLTQYDILPIVLFLLLVKYSPLDMPVNRRRGRMVRLSS